MPDCVETKASLDAITSLRDQYSNGQFRDLLNCISYDKETDQWVINATGFAKLEAAIVTLTKEEQTAYDAVNAAYTALLAIGNRTAQHFFKAPLINANNELMPDEVVLYLRH